MNITWIIAPRDGPPPTDRDNDTPAKRKALHPGAGVTVVVDEERIIAVGLLTRRELDALGPMFRRVWPVTEAPCFSGLLQAIDEADRRLRRDRDVAEERTDVGQ